MIKKPTCKCFADENDGDGRARASAIIAAQQMSFHLVSVLKQNDLCQNAAQYVLEHSILNMVTFLAIAGTAIDEGSQEAEWETDRILTGIETRLRERVKELYAMLRDSRRQGVV